MIPGFFLLLLGLLCYAIVRRGWAVGYHPSCRHCGFNLHALPINHPRCPECGANILLQDAIRIGDRRPVLWAMALGVLLALAGVTLSTVGLASWWPTFDASAYKPAAWLESDINSPSERQRTRACRELEHRIHAKSLSTAQLTHLAESLLKLQADRMLTWYLPWGDMIQAAHASGRLPTPLWRRYLTQSMLITAHVRPKIRIDDPIPLALECQLRAGSDLTTISPATLTPHITAALGTLTGHPSAHAIPVDIIPAQWVTLWIPNGPDAWPDTLAPGPQTLQLAVTLTFTDAGRIAGTVSTTFALPFELLARSQSSVTLERTAALEPDMRDAIRLRRRTASSGVTAFAIPEASNKPVPLASLHVSGPPVAAAFRLVLEQDSHQLALARFIVRPNDAATIPLDLPPFTSRDGPHAGPAELVFFPDPALAVGTTDILDVWGNDIHRPITLELQP